MALDRQENYIAGRALDWAERSYRKALAEGDMEAAREHKHVAEGLRLIVNAPAPAGPTAIEQSLIARYLTADAAWAALCEVAKTFWRGLAVGSILIVVLLYLQVAAVHWGNAPDQAIVDMAKRVPVSLNSLLLAAPMLTVIGAIRGGLIQYLTPRLKLFLLSRVPAGFFRRWLLKRTPRAIRAALVAHVAADGDNAEITIPNSAGHLLRLTAAEVRRAVQGKA